MILDKNLDNYCYSYSIITIAEKELNALMD